MSLELIVYSALIFLASAGVAVAGGLLGKPANVYVICLAACAYCAGTCYLMIRFGALKKGVRAWRWMRYSFGLFALAGLYAFGQTVVMLVCLV